MLVVYTHDGITSMRVVITIIVIIIIIIIRGPHKQKTNNKQKKHSTAPRTRIGHRAQAVSATTCRRSRCEYRFSYVIGCTQQNKNIFPRHSSYHPPTPPTRPSAYPPIHKCLDSTLSFLSWWPQSGSTHGSHFYRGGRVAGYEETKNENADIVVAAEWHKFNILTFIVWQRSRPIMTSHLYRGGRGVLQFNIFTFIVVAAEWPNKQTIGVAKLRIYTSWSLSLSVSCVGVRVCPPLCLSVSLFAPPAFVG